MICSAPLNQLDPDQLSLFAFCAMTTVGDAGVYRHFLPRILELAADGAWEIGLEPEVIAGKLVYGDWRSWLTNQQEAVADLFDAAARLSLNYPLDDGCRIESWLTGVARLDLPVAHLLTAWREAHSSGAMLQLARFAADWAGYKREIVPPYWSDVTSGVREAVRSWLISRETMTQLADSLSRIRADDRWIVAGAIDRIRARLD